MTAYESFDEDDDLLEPTPSEALASTVRKEGLGAARPATADVAEKRLVSAGLSATLAADVVREAVAHGLPFAQPRALKKLVRGALARRMPVMADLGGEARTIAFVGAGGSGKTSATERLAAAYAAVDAEVVVVALSLVRRRHRPRHAAQAARRDRRGRRRRRAGRPPDLAPRVRAHDRRRAGHQPARPRRDRPRGRGPSGARRHRGPPRSPGHAQRGRRRRAGRRAGPDRPHPHRPHARRPDRPPGRLGWSWP